MNLTPSQIALLLSESNQQVSFDLTDGSYTVKLGNKLYTSSGGDKWMDNEFLIAPNSVQDQLNQMVQNYKRADQRSPEFNAPKILQHQHKRQSTNWSRALQDGKLEPWLVKYNDAIEQLPLSYLPRQLEPIFKNSSANYRMLDSSSKDYAVVFPTAQSLFSGFRGVYAFRKVAHINIPDYSVQQGDTFSEYINKIADAVGTDLSRVRDAIVSNDLGIFFRRDKRILTVTEWIPHDLLDKYDDLKQFADQIVESSQTNIFKLCEDINKTLKSIYEN